MAEWMPWQRKRAPVVTVTFGNGKVTAPVDAIDWARWFGVEPRDK